MSRQAGKPDPWNLFSALGTSAVVGPSSLLSRPRSAPCTRDRHVHRYVTWHTLMPASRSMRDQRKICARRSFALPSKLPETVGAGFGAEYAEQFSKCGPANIGLVRWLNGLAAFVRPGVDAYVAGLVWYSVFIPETTSPSSSPPWIAPRRRRQSCLWLAMLRHCVPHRLFFATLSS